MLTPLHAAAKGGTVESIEALVAAGGSLEARLHLGERGATPLHVAASRGRAKVVEALLAAGSSPEAQTDEGATPLVEAAARGHAGVVSALEAASVNFSQTNASCANSTPTEVSPAQLPTQLPQTFGENLRWTHHCTNWLLAAWSFYKYWRLAPGTSLPSLIDSLRASLLAVVLSMALFAIQSSFDPCIIALELDGQQHVHVTPICAWSLGDEDMVAHARVDPCSVASNLCEPAFTFWVLCRLCWLGNGAAALSSNMLYGCLSTLTRLWARARLSRHRLRPLALGCISYCWFLCICSTSLPISLLMCAGLGVALDVDWWVVERPFAGICLAAAFFPRHTAVYACASVAVASLHLMGPLVEAVKVGLAIPVHGPVPAPYGLGWAGRAMCRAINIWRVFIARAMKLCINTAVDKMAPAALIDRAMKLDIFPGNRPKHWPPSLIIPEALDGLNRDDATPRAFVCPLTMGLMHQPAVTPHGTTYEYEAIASWLTRNGRYPANESPERLSLSELAPNRVLRSMIEEWVAARSTT